MEKTFRLFLFCLISIAFFGCSGSRVQSVNKSLYQSLPQNLQQQTIQGYGSKIRVLDGKMAKLKADLVEKDHQVRLGYEDVEQKKRELKIARKYVRDLKGIGYIPICILMD